MANHSKLSPTSEQDLLNSQVTSDNPAEEQYSLPDVRHAYSKRVPVVVTFPPVGRTKQSFKDECDINRIMARYQATGILDHVKEALPQYLDVSAVDFQEAMDIVARGREIFADLPSSIRERFDNDPVKLLEFVHDPANLREAVDLGFLDKAVLEPPGKPGGDSQPPPQSTSVSNSDQKSGG